MCYKVINPKWNLSQKRVRNYQYLQLRLYKDRKIQLVQIYKMTFAFSKIPTCDIYLCLTFKPAVLTQEETQKLSKLDVSHYVK